MKKHESEIDENSSTDIESDDEDTRETVLKRRKKMQQRKKELIERLKLHEAASKFCSTPNHTSTSSRIKKPKASTSSRIKTPKAQKPTYHSLPRRKSLRLQNIEAASETTVKTLVATMKEKEEAPEPRPTSDEYSILLFDDSGKEIQEGNNPTFKNFLFHKIPTLFESTNLRLNKNKPNQTSYDIALQKMVEKGCLNRKVVEKRIYAIAIHPREDFLLVAAGSTKGTIGLLKTCSTKGPSESLSFPTYDRTVSCLTFPRSKSNKLYFSSYAGVVRSLDLTKGVFEKAIFDDDKISVSSFDLHDPLSNGIIAGCSNGDLLLLDSRTSSAVTTVDAHERNVKSVSVHPLYQHYFSTGSNDRFIKIFDLRSLSKKMKPVSVITDHSQTVDSAYFSPLSGRHLLTTSLDNTLRIYDTSNLTSPSMKSCITHNNFTGRWLSNFRAVWHPLREDVIAVGSMERPVRQIDVYNSKLVRIGTLFDEESLSSVCSLLALHPSRNVIAGGNSSGKVFVFED